MPSTEVLQASPKKVFAHYMPNFIVSLDNKDSSVDYYTRNYLAPNGEGGKHVAYGGFLRNRPTPRPVRSGTTSQWKQADMEEEVRTAIASGIDGFAIDLLQVPGNSTTTLWEYTLTMMRAAAVVDADFKIMIMPDMTAGPRDQTPEQLASHVATLASYPAAYRLADKRVVVSPFHAEGKSVDWWKQFMSVAKSKHGIDVALTPVFVNDANRLSYAPISYGYGNWGSRTPAWNDPVATHSTSKIGRITEAANLGKAWLQPVSIHDERPRSSIFDESMNTTNLRYTWEIAIKGKAPWVQLVTWNDYSEGSEIAPSVTKGMTSLDLNAYYLAWYKTGTAPKIVRDGVFLSHRKQPWAAKPSFAQTKLMAWRGGSAAQDKVEALTFTSAPSTVTVTVGSTTTTCQVDAGVDTCVVPLAPGAVKATLQRNGATLATVASRHTVTNTPYTQDLQYVAVSSWRDGTTTPAPVPTPTPTTSSPKPTTSTPAPTTSTPVPTTSSPVPTTSTPVPTTSSPKPTTSTPVPTTSSPAPTTSSPAPTTSSPAPTTTSPAPTPTPSASVMVPSATVTPKPTTSAPAPTTSSPAPTTTTAPGAVTALLRPTADTYANAGAPSQSFGDSSSLNLRGTLAAVTYMKFAIPAAPAGKTLASATLSMRTGTASYAASIDTFPVSPVSSAWDQTKLTWNERPTPSTQVIGRFMNPTQLDTRYSTALTTAEVAKFSGGTLAIAIGGSGGDSWWTWSGDHAAVDYRPALELTWR